MSDTNIDSVYIGPNSLAVITKTMRLNEHLPPSDPDPTLTILKGHLLVEELLWEFLFRVLPHPENLSSRMSFANAIALVKAASLRKLDSWVWEAATQLNTLRNSASHRIGDDTLQTRIDAFVVFVKNQDLSVPSFTEQHLQLGKLGAAIGLTYLGVCIELLPSSQGTEPGKSMRIDDPGFWTALRDAAKAARSPKPK